MSVFILKNTWKCFVQSFKILKDFFSITVDTKLYQCQVYNVAISHLYNLQSDPPVSLVGIWYHTKLLQYYQLCSLCGTVHPRDYFYNWQLVLNPFHLYRILINLIYD